MLGSHLAQHPHRHQDDKAGQGIAYHDSRADFGNSRATAGESAAPIMPLMAIMEICRD